MGNAIGRIFPSDPSYPRFRDLVEALGGQPDDPEDLRALAHIAMWYDHNDAKRLAALIRQARERDAVLLAQVSEAIKRTATQRLRDNALTVELPQGLATAIHQSVKGGLQ